MPHQVNSVVGKGGRPVIEFKVSVPMNRRFIDRLRQFSGGMPKDVNQAKREFACRVLMDLRRDAERVQRIHKRIINGEIRPNKTFSLLLGDDCERRIEQFMIDFPYVQNPSNALGILLVSIEEE